VLGVCGLRSDCNVKRRDDILSEKNEQKVSAADAEGSEDGRGDEDLRWRREFTAFQRCLGLEELEWIKEE
jgi:hypothetical protein